MSLVIGASARRTEAQARVMGGLTYTGDLELPGQWYAAVVRSPYPHAVIQGIDSAAAEHSGAIVLTAADLADVEPYFGTSIRDQPVVAIDRVRFVGEPVAAVAAPSREAAEIAAELVDVSYEELPSVVDLVTALLPGAPAVHSSHPEPAKRFLGGSPERFPNSPNVCAGYTFETGRGVDGFTEADETIEGTYTTPAIQHAHLEPHSAIASWADGRLTVWTSTQGPSVVRSQLAELFRLAQSRVRVLVPEVGGGFGGKSFSTIEPLVAALARKARRPVRLVLRREEVFDTLVRHAATVRMRTGYKRDGTLVAREVEILYDTGAYADSGPRTCRKGGRLSAGPYRIAHQSVRSMAIYTNKVTAGAFRGFGLPQICWAYESQMDEIAHQLSMDPTELRRRNLLQDGDAPVAGEQPIDFGIEACLDAVVGAMNGLVSDASANGSPSIVRGSGVACAMKSMTSPTTSTATVSLNADASVQVLTSSVDLGQGSRTALAQIAAEVLGRTADEVHVSMPDTDVTPFDQGTISSRTTYSAGRAVMGAAEKVRAQLLAIAGSQLEIAADELDLAGDWIVVREAPTRRTAVADVLRGAFRDRGGALTDSARVAVGNHGDPVPGETSMRPAWMFAAAGAEVAVDRDTGQVRIERIIVASDVGKAINPRLCHLQNEGNMLMALGAALFEELVHDHGQPLNSSFLAYPLPSLRDHPARFDSLLVETPHPDGPFGARGVGEAAIAPVAAAIGNALAAALGGVRVRHLPITPERVVEALGAARGDRAVGG